MGGAWERTKARRAASTGPAGLCHPLVSHDHRRGSPYLHAYELEHPRGATGAIQGADQPAPGRPAWPLRAAIKVSEPDVPQ